MLLQKSLFRQSQQAGSAFVPPGEDCSWIGEGREEGDLLVQLEQTGRALTAAQGRLAEIICRIMLTGDAETVARFSQRVARARLRGTELWRRIQRDIGDR